MLFLRHRVVYFTVKVHWPREGQKIFAAFCDSVAVNKCHDLLAYLKCRHVVMTDTLIIFH